MLNHKDLDRLLKLKADIALLRLQYPVTIIAKRTDTDIGNASKYLNGSLPLGKGFIKRFYEAFADELSRVALKQRDPYLRVENHVSEMTKAIKDLEHHLRAIEMLLSEFWSENENQVGRSSH